MWRQTSLAGLLILAGCATAPSLVDPKAEDPRFGNPCKNRTIELSFDDASATPRSAFLRPLEWAMRAQTQCRLYVLIAKGLPYPSQTSLQGRRATNVQVLTESFGLRDTRFDPGNARDQAHPYLELRAKP